MRQAKLSRWSRWACTVVCAALMVACVFGALWELRWSTGTHGWINIGYGGVGAGRIDDAEYARRYPDEPPWTPPRGWSLHFTGVYLTELWPAYQADPYGTWGCIPLWIPLLLAAIPTALLWRLELRARRRARRGRCPLCGYDRRGLATDAACPECGTLAMK